MAGALLLARPPRAPAHRAGQHRIYRTIGGYVTGNLFISSSPARLATLVLYPRRPIRRCARPPRRDPRPRAARGRDTRGDPGLDHRVHDVVAHRGLIVVAFFVVYQQIENHFLQPLVYSRTVQLSPLAILISVLIGAEFAGVLGALAAIPVAGTIQVLIGEWLQMRSERALATAEPEPL